MDYGVTITRGVAPWQIFQQGPGGTACIRLEGKYHLVHLSQELPLQFSAVPPCENDREGPCSAGEHRGIRRSVDGMYGAGQRKLDDNLSAGTGGRAIPH